jgi:hypothetical protein
MPVKRQIQYVKHNLATSDYTYVMPFNKSWELLELGVDGAGAGQGLNVIINGVSLLYLPGLTGSMVLAAPPYVSANMRGYFEQLREKFPEVSLLRVCPGEQLTIARASTAGACTLYMWFRELEAPDVLSPDDPGGSNNPMRLYNNYVRVAPTVAAGATVIVEVDTSLSPSGYLDFPVRELVMAGYNYEFLGLAISYDAGGSPNTTCNGVRIWHQDESILAPNETFAPIDTYPIQGIALDKRLFLLPERRVWLENELMKIEYSFTNAGGAAESPIMHTGLIFRLVKL